MTGNRSNSADDALNEYLIDFSYRSMMAARDDAGKRMWCDRLTYWVGQRSPERIAQMERERGLSPKCHDSR